METDWSPWHMVLYGLVWSDYERLLAAREAAGRKRMRITYDRGTAEIYTPGGGPRFSSMIDEEAWLLRGTDMVVGNRHERWKKLLARLLEAAILGFRVPVTALGNFTLNRADLEHGLEPDECYYLRHAADMASGREFNPQTDPPPDLAVEIEVSRNVLDRLELYANLGVRELWRYDGEHLQFLVLSATGEYIESAVSIAFPLLTVERFSSYLARAGTVDDTTLCLEFMNWAQQAAPPTA